MFCPAQLLVSSLALQTGRKMEAGGKLGCRHCALASIGQQRCQHSASAAATHPWQAKGPPVGLGEDRTDMTGSPSAMWPQEVAVSKPGNDAL